jgi:hypothetical protein
MTFSSYPSFEDLAKLFPPGYANYVGEVMRAFQKPLDEMSQRGMGLGLSSKHIAIAIGVVATRCAARAIVDGSLTDPMVTGALEREIKYLREERAARKRPLS